ncbi:hypothetical protein ATANTOWER_000893 [Ataeniobius toweri]|uniref:Uncharacterized protein n=1 Tax=Ataeniobius toweri TaxID=208326 RepID=A0ABU7BCZ3_9TELE|nr:hypothetical protein [Ataeniobius toweri]
MMIPSVIAPPALYPGLYRPAATLPSAFPAHSSFLVEDLLRLSRPTAFINRTVPPVSASLPAVTTSASYNGASAERALATAAVTRESCSPKISKDPGFLKFGVSAILAPSPKIASSPPGIHSLHSKTFPVSCFDGTFHPIFRTPYLPGGVASHGPPASHWGRFWHFSGPAFSHSGPVATKPPSTVTNLVSTHRSNHPHTQESDFYQAGQRREPVMH